MGGGGGNRDQDCDVESGRSMYGFSPDTGLQKLREIGVVLFK